MYVPVHVKVRGHSDATVIALHLIHETGFLTDLKLVWLVSVPRDPFVSVSLGWECKSTLLCVASLLGILPRVLMPSRLRLLLALRYLSHITGAHRHLMLEGRAWETLRRISEGSSSSHAQLQQTPPPMLLGCSLYCSVLRSSLSWRSTLAMNTS